MRPLDFVNPLSEQNLRDIRWYLEAYSSQYMMDVDDDRAERIKNSLSRWGSALFTAALGQFEAQAAFMDFYGQNQPGRVLTIGASHPDILGLPWELLHIPGGGFLFNSNPRISIRRQFNVFGGFNLTEYQPKERIRILFIISRPENAGFIDPRSDTQAVLAALEKEGRSRVDVEFLRPATIDALRQRLDDRRLPAIDIVHFDGHGVYDPSGDWFEEARQSGGIDLSRRSSSADAADMGYLLFEDADRLRAPISAEKFAAILNEQAIGLIVLSACQSAMVGSANRTAEDGDADEGREEEAIAAVMGSVAARLTHVGIPAVLAMTHSVLVSTTRELFGAFYQNLMMGYGMGEALDNARRHLYMNKERGERQRGQERVVLKLQDWFLPALYQAGSDTPLLLNMPVETTADGEVNPSDSSTGFGNLPELKEAGFFGRSRELWAIERAFVQGTRRISIVGFGGQGKTFLAQEAGRWLCQTGMFQRVYFVNYAGFQDTSDAVEMALSTLRYVLNTNIKTVEEATAALRQTATLLILDNLEVLTTDSLRGLLDVAQVWSKLGRCRVLLTSRQPDFDHAGYKTEGSREHIRIRLRGLGSETYPVDALNYFQALVKLPPAPTVAAPDRAALVNLFKLVDFHPLSIGLLARQLKDRRLAELGQRLERLLAETADDKDKSLVASLNLSLDRVGPEVREWLPRLGVFQGGAFEDDLLWITGLSLIGRAQLLLRKQTIEKWQQGEAVAEAESGYSAEQYEQLLQAAQQNPEALTDVLAQINDDMEIATDADASTWPTLRQALVASGLLQPEPVPGVGVPFLKFHPTLAPVLWPQLSDAEQSILLARHRQRYYQLSSQMYHEDDKNPLAVRAIVQRELPNLLMAVKDALAAGDADAVEFVDNVSKFLGYFGLKQDQQVLTDKLAQTMNKLTGEVGLQAWYLARNHQGEMLYAAGRHAEAVKVFEEIMAGLGDEPRYEQCVTLSKLGGCFEAQGQAMQAAACYRQGLTVAAQLEQSDGVKRQEGVLDIKLATVLIATGDYVGAKKSYEAALKIAKSQSDERQVGVAEGQLGTLALVQGDLGEAVKRYQAALQTFQQLGEPAAEATAWHQLGMAYEEDQQWDEAERHYRESARIAEKGGELAGAAQTWNQLALVSEGAGRIEAAIAWYKKAIEGKRASDTSASLSGSLSNLAYLLQTQQNAAGQFTHLKAARQHAEESLTIKQTLDPAAAKIWITYGVLAEIAEKQERAEEAQGYRQQARQAKAAFAGTQYELQRYGPLIVDVVSAATGNEEVKAQLLAQIEEAAQNGESTLVSALRRILEGDRDEADLLDPLDYDESMILMAILQGIADPSSLERFTPEAQSSET